MTSFSHREFTVSRITQKFTSCQMLNFRYNVDIYDTNMESIKNYNYNHSLLRYYVIITLQKLDKIIQFHITEPRYKINLIHLKLVDAVTLYFEKMLSHRQMMT